MSFATWRSPTSTTPTELPKVTTVVLCRSHSHLLDALRTRGDMKPTSLKVLVDTAAPCVVLVDIATEKCIPLGCVVLALTAVAASRLTS